jgi:hypothetical protein
MRLYLSGNFPQLATPGKEKAFKEMLEKENRPYHRLITFYYKQHCQTVLGIIKEDK